MSDIEAREAFPRILAKYMQERGMNQSAVARSVNVSKQIVSDWLRGKKFPRVDKKKDIAYHQITASQTTSKDRVRFYLQKIADGKRNDTEFLKSLVNSFINSITVYNDCLRVVVNAAENVERIPADELPPIDELPLFERFDFQPSASNRLVTVEPYPVIVFKIAI